MTNSVVRCGWIFSDRCNYCKVTVESASETKLVKMGDIAANQPGACRTEFYTTNFRSITFIILLNHGIYNVSSSTIRVYLSNDAIVCITKGLPQSP